ncbi:MAG: DUF6435 family protein [bacterium]|nr:DUF6435 family protein [bacterium]
MLAAARQEGFPAPVFVHRAGTETAEKFFAARAPAARVIEDPEGKLFAGFGLGTGSFLQLFGLRVFLRAFAAMARGNFVGKPTSHATQMPGAFVVRAGEVLFSHRAKHTGDHPDLAAIHRAIAPNAPAVETAAVVGDAAPDKAAARRRKSLSSEHRRVLAEAQKQQRNGDLRAFADLTARADEISRELDALEQT